MSSFRDRLRHPRWTSKRPCLGRIMFGLAARGFGVPAIIGNGKKAVGTTVLMQARFGRPIITNIATAVILLNADTGDNTSQKGARARLRKEPHEGKEPVNGCAAVVVGCRMQAKR